MTLNLKDDDDRVHITSIQTHFRFFFQMDLHLWFVPSIGNDIHWGKTNEEVRLFDNAKQALNPVRRHARQPPYNYTIPPPFYFEESTLALTFYPTPTQDYIGRSCKKNTLFVPLLLSFLQTLYLIVPFHKGQSCTPLIKPIATVEPKPAPPR